MKPLFIIVFLASSHCFGQQNNIDTNYRSEYIKMQQALTKYQEKIEGLLQECIVGQLYLQVDCSLLQISDKLRIPAHHLTYYFNNIKRESFSDWRNRLRVEDAINILSQDTLRQLTLEAIGLKVGFTC